MEPFAMPSSSPVAVRHLRRAATLCDNRLHDAELLDGFLSQRDEAAFEALVRRHGPMVLGVCRRVIGNVADADDAFQATFLVLVRRAASLRKRELLGNWLYGVAFRTALGARSRMLRRRVKEQPMKELPHPAYEADDPQRELLAHLDRELNRLPAKLRDAVVLCELNGTPRKRAAKQLGIPEGTLSSRLAAARQMLAARLRRNGVAVSVASVTAALSQSEAPAMVPAALIGSTVQAAADLAAGVAIPAPVAALTHGVLHSMLLKKLKLGAGIVAAFVLGAGLLTYGFSGQTPVAAAPQDPARKDKPIARPPANGQDKLDGAWKIVTMSEGGKARPPQPQGPTHLFFIKGKSYFANADRVEAIFTWTTNPTKTPKEIDLTIEDRKLAGIYSIERDTLKICVGDPASGTRPTSFEAGAKVALLTLQRDPDAKLPDLQKADGQVTQARARMLSANNLKQITLAMHNYHDTNQAFPAAAIYDKNGKPLLSWRVAILPFIEQDVLFKEFKLDEPWDSEHNKKLLAQMPKVYGDKGTKTVYRVFHGRGAVFEGTKGIKLADITDGTSNTMLVVEAAEAVDWTKPDELEYDPEKKLPKLGGMFDNGFHIALADGSVRMLPHNVEEKLLRALITRNGGEVIDESNPPAAKPKKPE
jgi:RNA polymerase sigma factor (sigma-70 family)